MSEKKPHLNEEAQEEPSSIEIVTVGVRHGQTEIINKERPQQTPAPTPAPAPAPVPEHAPAPEVPPPQAQQPVEEPQAEEEVQVSHTNLGDRENEEKIREHVEGMLHQIQAQEENAEESHHESGQDSNAEQQQQVSSRSQKSNKKGGPRSSYQSNDERRDEGPSSRRCFNKLCTSKKIYKKIRSRVQQNKYRFFCKSCYQNYYGNLFCEFCEQIYSASGDNQDDDKWIGCDNCDRWNHIECEKKFRGKNINILKDKNEEYYCLACTQKTKTSDKAKKAEKEEEKATIKQKLEVNKDLRIPIFNKKMEPFPNLQYFLQNYSFRLWMNQGQIREDLEHLRSACLKNVNIEEVAKKGKKVKTE